LYKDVALILGLQGGATVAEECSNISGIAGGTKPNAGRLCNDTLGK
jgi:hypothetical protein